MTSAPARFMDMDQAAAELHVSRRKLSDLLTIRPDCCVWGGRKKVLKPEHIASLQELIEEQTKCRIARTAKKAPTTGGLTSRSKAVSGYEEALDRLTKLQQRKSRPKLKLKSGGEKSTVIPLQQRSQRP